MKSRRRWRKNQGAHEVSSKRESPLVPYAHVTLQATLNAYETLDSLWASTYTGSRTDIGCQERVIAVLQEVDSIEWDRVRPRLEEELVEARVLAKDAEALMSSVTDLEGPCSGKLKFECTRLLCRTQLWVAAEEEIICLMDQGQEVLDDALYQDKLVWQSE